MKKFITLFLFLISILFVCNISFAQDEISVYLDGQRLGFDAKPCLVNGRTLVPVRGVLEAAGATVSWDNEARMTVATKDDVTVMIGVDNTTMAVKKQGKTKNVEFDVAPCIIESRTFVAIKHVAEAFGINVGWNGEKQMVILDSNYKVSSVPNKIEFSDFAPPREMKAGDQFCLSGSVSADGVLDRVNIKVTDVNTARVQINETEFNVNQHDYYFYDSDNILKFGRLSTGTKLMEITAVTKNETRAVYTAYFDVAVPNPPQLSGDSAMLWPVPKSGFMTTIFWCDNPFCHSNGGRARGHAALDIAAPENFDVIAVKNGKVTKTVHITQENANVGYGNYIVIDHGDGYTTQYSHLYSIYVEPGDYVYAGQIIGGVGTTGSSTGNHLDFAIEKNGQRQDPLRLLEMHPRVRCFEECDQPIFKDTLAKRGIEAPENDEYYFYDYY